MSIASTLAKNFHEHESLALALLPHAVDTSAGDGAHDHAHLMRVWRNACLIMKNDGGDTAIITAAVILHDCVSVEKNSPQRHLSSRLAAKKADGILHELGWSTERRQAVFHAIEAHSHSAGVEPLTLEACILQDADRLDALGLIGIARCFYVAGRMGSALYDQTDIAGKERSLDDRRFALDHFPCKLLRLSGGFRTTTGARLAKERHEQLQSFYDQLIGELS